MARRFRISVEIESPRSWWEPACRNRCSGQLETSVWLWFRSRFPVFRIVEAVIGFIWLPECESIASQLHGLLVGLQSDSLLVSDNGSQSFLVSGEG
ncbi:hypothetical protein RBSWK_00420 [Rhodopirellula baltica SWK14]|uniref:Uncharacterized protein n=1 Tax=Rhodopirellula baltica SWK14 TaxID=993516 RepID=L7CPD0_RHOBT|nr:hypothetical protein RBSWK_00420 [Rhodopirellula baltica SWK14]